MSVSGQLTNLQLELLRIFQYELTQSQLIEIKSLLASYFASKATAEMDKIWDEKKWTPELMDELLNKDLRKSNNG